MKAMLMTPLLTVLPMYCAQQVSKVLPSHTTAQRQLSASTHALLNEPGPCTTQQLDRRSLLLGVVFGSQLLNIQLTQLAFADELSDINTVSACYALLVLLGTQPQSL